MTSSEQIDVAVPPSLGHRDHGMYLRPFRVILGFCRRKPLGAFGALIILLLLVLAAFPDLFAPSAYDHINLSARLQSPSASHLFGTDNQGRDVLSRTIYGARTSVTIGFGVVAVAAVLSTLIGLTSGYYGGLFDLFFQRIMDIWQACPGLIFIIFLLSIFTASETTLITALGITFSAGSSRVIRGSVLQVKENMYIEAAHAMGVTDFRILTRHILPNVFPIILINASVQIGAVILIEASLSFLGFGVPPPFPSWGGMLQAAQADMRRHPNLALYPGLAIATTVYSFNMLGDALRDVLDPRLRGSR